MAFVHFYGLCSFFLRFIVIDVFNQVALNITIDTAPGSKRVIRELNQRIDWRHKPEMIRVDNGPELLHLLWNNGPN
jgi:hypothetical protein